MEFIGSMPKAEAAQPSMSCWASMGPKIVTAPKAVAAEEPRLRKRRRRRSWKKRSQVRMSSEVVVWDAVGVVEACRARSGRLGDATDRDGVVGTRLGCCLGCLDVVGRVAVLKEALAEFASMGEKKACLVNA